MKATLCDRVLEWGKGGVGTCKDHQAATLLSVPDLASSQQHVVQVQRVALVLPQHGPGELVQAVIGLLALNQRFGGRRERHAVKQPSVRQ